MTFFALVAAASFVAGPGERAVVHACIDSSSQGQVLRDRGDLIGARAQFRACAADACPRAIRSDCTRWLASVEQAIPTLVVAVRRGELDVPGVSVTVDGVPVRADGHPFEIDPGNHQLEAVKDGVAQHEAIVVAAGERNRLLVIQWKGAAPAPAPARLQAAAPPEVKAAAPRPQASSHAVGGPLVLGAIGVAGLGVFAGVGAWGQNELNGITSSPCGQSKSCAPGTTDGVQTKYVVADVGLGVGIASLAAALVWYVIPIRPAAVALSTDGRSLALSGRF
ncbi:MAG TPA: hypothetical protein VMB50_23685 [Myxococcales bacterium]|nr:hypothetical protein [Myxococcales bacterium]